MLRTRTIVLGCASYRFAGSASRMNQQAVASGSLHAELLWNEHLPRTFSGNGERRLLVRCWRSRSRTCHFYGQL